MLGTIFNRIFFKAFELLRRMERCIGLRFCPTPERVRNEITKALNPPSGHHPAGLLHNSQNCLSRKTNHCNIMALKTVGL